MASLSQEPLAMGAALYLRHEYGVLEPGAALLLAEDHKERALIYHRRHDFAAAVAAYSEALAVRPGYALVHRLRAEALVELNRLPEAALDYNHYLRAASGSLDSFVKLREPVAAAYRASALVKARIGNASGSLDDLRRALELDPDAGTHALCGWTYLNNGAPRPALAEFTAALKEDPANADAYAGRGFAQVRVGNLEQALADAEAALRLAASHDAFSKSAAVHFWKVARVFAQAVPVVQASLARKGIRSAEEEARYRDRAVRLLDRALISWPPEERGAFLVSIGADPALAPLRGSEEYLRFARIMAAATK
jgi:tetratricopeptide (TPR) repeat protein